MTDGKIRAPDQKSVVEVRAPDVSLPYLICIRGYFPADVIDQDWVGVVLEVIYAEAAQKSRLLVARCVTQAKDQTFAE